MSCEYCHKSPHDPRCPNANYPVIRGNCAECGEELREDLEFYKDREGNKFCCEECGTKYHGIQAAEWEDEVDWI